MKKDLEKYKTEISLPDYVIAHGYNPAKRSTNDYIRLEKKDGEDKSIIICHRNAKGHWLWFSPSDDLRGRTIFDFYFASNKNATWEKAIGSLDEYIKTGKAVFTENSKFNTPPKEVTKTEALKHFAECQPLTDDSFLKGRGIKDEILNHPYFKGYILNKTFTDKESGITHVNCAFPMINEIGEITGVSQKNENFGGCLGQRGEGLAMSVYQGDKLDHLFIGESMLDCISHFQLNYDKLKDQNVRYVSSEGSFSSLQIEIINKLIDKYRPEITHIITDNDIAGERYRTFIMGRLQLPKIENEFSKNFSILTSINTENRFVARNEFVFTYPDKDTGIVNLTKFKNSIHEYFKDMPVAPQTKVSQIGNNGANVEVVFDNTLENWQGMNQFLYQMKFELSPQLSHDRSQSKDFNDDLRQVMDVSVIKVKLKDQEHEL